MNVKELKKLARDWVGATPRSGLEIAAAQAMNDAIMALPDDPQAEHQDLVEMAGVVKKNRITVVQDAFNLAAAVIERFGKREPRKVEAWVAMWGDNPWCVFREKDDALKYIKECEKKSLWLARLTGTEEV